MISRFRHNGHPGAAISAMAMHPLYDVLVAGSLDGHLSVRAMLRVS